MILKRLKNKLSFKNLVRYFVNLLYPYRCPCCRKIVNNDSFCDKCWKKLIFIEKPTCSICGEPLDIKTNYVTKNVLKYLSNVETPNTVVGICAFKNMSIKGNKLLILDSIQDPGNLGTIIRSSVAFNIDTIIINDKCADIYSDKVIRSSQGMIFKTNIVKQDLYDFISKIKGQIKIYGTKIFK